MAQRPLYLIVRQRISRPWHEYPVGTLAHSINGGAWEKTLHGWKWQTGSTFPTPGADACSVTVPNAEVRGDARHEREQER